MIDKQIFKIEGVKNILSWLVILTFLQAVSILFQAFFLSKSIVILWHQSSFSSAVPYIFGFAISLLCRHFFSLIKEGSIDVFIGTGKIGSCFLADCINPIIHKIVSGYITDNCIGLQFFQAISDSLH